MEAKAAANANGGAGSRCRQPPVIPEQSLAGPRGEGFRLWLPGRRPSARPRDRARHSL